MNDEIKAFLIDRAAPPKTAKKDTLQVVFSPKLSNEHFSTEWSAETAVYFVHNLTKGHNYTVAFYAGRTGEVLVASCDCPARVMCKHISAAWDVHAKAETAGFLPKIQTKDDL